MGVGANASLVISLVLSILIFSGMQMYKVPLGSSRMFTLLSGFTSSWLFVLLLTALSNLESIVFGSKFQAKFIPEVLICLSVACTCAGMVHRVSVTVCFLCSMVALYYINRISQNFYAVPVAPVVMHSKKKK